MNQAESTTIALTGMRTATIATQRRVCARSNCRSPSSSIDMAASGLHTTGGKSNISRFCGGAAAFYAVKSLPLDACAADDAAPFGDFSPQPAGKLVRRGRQRLKAEL